MGRILLVIALTASLLVSNPSMVDSAGYASCVSVTDAEITEEFGDSVYSLDLVDLCESGIRNYSLILKSNKSSVPNVTRSYVIIHSYGTTVSFSLNRYSPGDYSPSLEISSSKDFERRTISLPRFRIDSPLDCLQVINSGLDNSRISYSLTLRKICNTLNSSSFQSIELDLQGAGLYGIYIRSERLYSVSDYQTSVKFTLGELPSGNYFPKLIMKDKKSLGSREIDLNSFSIEKAKPSVSPKDSYKQLCVSGKNYKEECFTYPNFSYEICSSRPSGKVQYKSGSGWLFGWNFKGEKNLERCTSSVPFLISISGTSETTLNMRLRYKKYKNSPAFYSYFKVKVT